MTSFLISIQPEFAQKIFSGEKKFEFRRRPPKVPSPIEVFLPDLWTLRVTRHPDAPASVYYIYTSSPIMEIQGFFISSTIISGRPDLLWTYCEDGAGIDFDRFLDYFAERKDVEYNYFREEYVAHAIGIDAAYWFDRSIELDEIGVKWAPQNFNILSPNSLSRLAELNRGIIPVAPRLPNMRVL